MAFLTLNIVTLSKLLAAFHTMLLFLSNSGSMPSRLAYLINHMPTLGLNMKSPLEVLFQCPPNYTKLRTIGCLCFPWLGRYTSNKLLPKSHPCVFLDYSPTQSPYLCFNPTIEKLYTSCHVHFIKNLFIYASKPISTNHFFSPIVDPYPMHQTSNLTTLHHPTLLDPTTENLSYQTTSNSSQNLSTLPPLVHPSISSPNNMSTHNTTQEILCTASSSPNVTAALPPCSTVTAPISEPMPTATAPLSHPMVTYAKNGIFKPKHIHLATKFPFPNLVALVASPKP